MNINLVLEDGSCFEGLSIGAPLTPSSEIFGEVVFNTAMTGYQEAMSDPSYCDQILTFTYPMIGNYGINRDDMETLTPYLKAVVVNESCQNPSNWRTNSSFHEFLKTFNIPGIAGVDTRKLTRIIRKQGTMKGLLTRSKTFDGFSDLQLPEDQVQKVSTKSAYSIQGKGPRVIVIDYGCKSSILDYLKQEKFEIIVVPYNAGLNDINALRPDGIFLSNGPGDPKTMLPYIKNIQQLQQTYPVFGICLGHQLLALAGGADTVKLKFGHRGYNHPVKNLKADRTFMTSQNHGYTVDKKSLENTQLSITEVNLNDDTIAGLRHLVHPTFSVQYHPEANPGPHDSSYLFGEFNHYIQEKAKR